MSKMAYHGVKSDVKASRMGILLKDVTGKNSVNRRKDIVAVNEKYSVLKGHLKALVASLKAEHEALTRLNEARLETAKVIAQLSANSPLYETCGKFPNESESSAQSFASVRSSFVAKNRMMSERYSQFIVNYAVEWEKVVVTRINADLKKNDTLRRELDHYEVKVESLRQSANVTMSRGKMVDPKVTEKLNRNESKLMESRQQYENFANSLCNLMDELTTFSWKDLHPLMIKLMQFDNTRAKDESTCFAQLDPVLSSMKSLGSKFHIKPEARLKEIATQDANLLASSGSEYMMRSDTSGYSYGSNAQDLNTRDFANHDPLADDVAALTISSNTVVAAPPSNDIFSPIPPSSTTNSTNDFNNALTYKQPANPTTDLLSMNDVVTAPAPTLDSVSTFLGSSSSALTPAATPYLATTGTSVQQQQQQQQQLQSNNYSRSSSSSLSYHPQGVMGGGYGAPTPASSFTYQNNTPLIPSTDLTYNPNNQPANQWSVAPAPSTYQQNNQLAQTGYGQQTYNQQYGYKQPMAQASWQNPQQPPPPLGNNQNYYKPRTNPFDD